MVGIPCAGKTTAIVKFYPEATIISPDNHIGYTEENPWTTIAVRYAWKKADKLLDEAFVAENELIVFDATFIKPKRRRKYIDKAKKNNYEVVALYCQVLYKVAIDRNNERSKFRAVPRFVIDRMSKDLEPPTKEEGFNKIIIFNSVTNELREE